MVEDALKCSLEIGEKVEEYDLYCPTIVPGADIPDFELSDFFGNYYDRYEYISKFAHSKKRKISTALNQKKSVEKALRPVALLDDENNILSIFRSIKIAGEITNIPQQNIGEVCRGNRDSAGGFKWEYVDKDLFNTVTQEIV